MSEKLKLANELLGVNDKAQRKVPVVSGRAGVSGVPVSGTDYDPKNYSEVELIAMKHDDPVKFKAVMGL